VGAAAVWLARRDGMARRPTCCCGVRWGVAAPTCEVGRRRWQVM